MCYINFRSFLNSLDLCFNVTVFINCLLNLHFQCSHSFLNLETVPCYYSCNRMFRTFLMQLPQKRISSSMITDVLNLVNRSLFPNIFIIIIMELCRQKIVLNSRLSQVTPSFDQMLR